MASESNKTDSLITCRYCLTNTKDHNVQYFIKDKQDKYERMLEDTFNVQICISENKYMCLECEEDFRNAAEIKKRVLNVQKKLLEQIEKLDIDTPKKEINGEYCEWDFQDSGEMGAGGTRDSGKRVAELHSSLGLKTTDTEDEILKPENPKKEIYSDYEDYFEHGGGDDGTKDDGRGDDGKKNDIANGDAQNNAYIVKEAYVKIERMESPPRKKRKIYTKIIDLRNLGNNVKENVKNVRKDCPKSLLQMRKNTLILLNNSNMCVFTSRRTKYACYSCNELFLEMPKLRVHSQTHRTDKIERAINKNRGLTLKTVDISNLACKKCTHLCTDLEELRVHLKNKHNEALEGTEHLLIPFNIENGFKCVICREEFLSFRRLFIHMNCHSNCNVCETCGVSFNNRCSLRNHIKCNHSDNKCSICLAVFSTATSKTKHLRVAHNIDHVKRYCTHCDMVFRYHYKLQEHMVEKHGAKKPQSICDICKKVFASSLGVKSHYKAVHLGEKKHECSLCQLSFFTSFDRKRHEKTHGSDKPFSCDMCDVKFKSIDSKRRHLRRKHGSDKV